MIVVDCEQGTEAWDKARLGIPTASNFHKILSPTGKPSKQADLYLYKLLAEWLTGEPEEGWMTDAMAAGYLTQPEAIEYFELTTDRKVEPIGFAYLDDRKIVGSSPDGLVGDDSGIEIKAPIAGELVDLRVQAGDTVSTGAVLAVIR